MAGFVFNGGAEGLQNGSIDWAADTIKVRLVETTDTLNKDDDVMTGLGITTDDITLGSKTGGTKDDSTDRVVYDAADPTFVTVPLGPEVDRMLTFKFVTDDSDSIPIAVVDITPTTPNGGNIVVTIDAAGLFYTQQ